mmetsp:Transcript_5500/g.21746  ORF Transcript_5500/g.21746 Transcript_5500/m.21746 type:complete len:207 (-) Transcript_5500:518-1138(-)
MLLSCSAAQALGSSATRKLSYSAAGIGLSQEVLKLGKGYQNRFLGSDCPRALRRTCVHPAIKELMLLVAKFVEVRILLDGCFDPIDAAKHHERMLVRRQREVVVLAGHVSLLTGADEKVVAPFPWTLGDGLAKSFGYPHLESPVQSQLLPWRIRGRRDPLRFRPVVRPGIIPPSAIPLVLRSVQAPVVRHLRALLHYLHTVLAPAL